MSSLNNLVAAPLSLNGDFLAEAGVQWLMGSFQGNANAAPKSGQVRGSWFYVSYVGTGQYRVVLQGLKPDPTIVPVQNTSTAGSDATHPNGQPNGLIVEPFGWVVSETVATQPASPWVVQGGKFDATNNRFDLFTGVITDAAGTLVLTDVTSADRVFFKLGWKIMASLP